MQTHIELIGPINSYLALVFQVLTAILAGGIIGFEREVRMKAAGLRTNMLICLGATLYTAIAMFNAHQGTGPIDPNRLPGQIVSGIGFLGAGAIMHGRGQIVGMTTAATIWLVAAVGVCIGSGYPITAFGFVLVTVAVLRLIDPLYRIFRDEKVFHLDVLSYGSVRVRVDSLLSTTDDKVLSAQEWMADEEENLVRLHLEIKTDEKRLAYMMNEIRHMPSVKSVGHQLRRELSHMLVSVKEAVEEEHRNEIKIKD